MAGLINQLLTLFVLAIFLRSILTWFPISRNNPIQVFVFQVTEPILSPLRRYLPRLGYFDLSPMVAIILIVFLIQPAVRNVFG